MDVEAGSVKVDFHVNNGTNFVTDEVAFTVYTGLKLTGAKANEATGQLADATGWTLHRDGDGYVWRTGGAKTPPQWQTDARGYVGTILESRKATSIQGQPNTYELIFLYDNGIRATMILNLDATNFSNMEVRRP